MAVECHPFRCTFRHTFQLKQRYLRLQSKLVLSCIHDIFYSVEPISSFRVSVVLAFADKITQYLSIMYFTRSFCGYLSAEIINKSK